MLTLDALGDGVIRPTPDGPGLDALGITTAASFDDVAVSIRSRVAEEMHAGMSFTFADPDRSTDVTTTHPWARSLVVGIRSYLPEAGTPGAERPGTARIARFSEDDHYHPLRKALDTVAERLSAVGHRTAVLVDDNRLVDRAAAVRAGLGWWGKNTMVLTPGLGPWFLIGSVVTDADLEPTAPMQRGCGTCEACLPACPTGALVAPGVLDARRCLAAILQSKGSIPIEFREAVGDRFYGCDDCLDACPPGSRLLERAQVERAQADRGRVIARDLLRLDDAELLDRYDRFYVPGRRPRYLRRNLLVVLGNVGSVEDVDVVSEHRDHPDDIVSEHARWAFERMVERGVVQSEGTPSGK